MKKQYSLLYVLLVFTTILKAQNIQYLPLYDDNTFNRPLNMETGSNVPIGKTAGAVDVSALGGASYTVPIALPPGTKGIVNI